MLNKQLEFIIKGGDTKRYHTNGFMPQQSVAEHSFRVAALLSLIYPEYDKIRQLVCCAIFHDLAEGQVGDIAAPVKRQTPELKELLDREELMAFTNVGLADPNRVAEKVGFKRMLKIADNLEGLLFAADEIRRGNKDAIEIYNNYHSYIVALNPIDKELEVFNLIQRRVLCQMQIAHY